MTLVRTQRELHAQQSWAPKKSCYKIDEKWACILPRGVWFVYWYSIQ